MAQRDVGLFPAKRKPPDTYGYTVATRRLAELPDGSPLILEKPLPIERDRRQNEHGAAHTAIGRGSVPHRAVPELLKQSLAGTLMIGDLAASAGADSDCFSVLHTDEQRVGQRCAFS